MRSSFNKISTDILIWFTLCLCLTTLFSCHEEKKYRIGVSQCSQDDWRMKMNEEIQREIMYHDDVDVEIRSADDSSEKQINEFGISKTTGSTSLSYHPTRRRRLLL